MEDTASQRYHLVESLLLEFQLCMSELFEDVEGVKAVVDDLFFGG